MAEEQADGDKAKLKRLQEQIKLYKYVGESARSLYERGFEHLMDFESLSTKSHMLKHAVDKHTDEDPTNIQFGIRIIKSSKSSYERQTYESSAIQESRKYHFLLNSRSEYNRCAVPRLMCKLGDKAYKRYEKEMEKDLAKEEEQMPKKEITEEKSQSQPPQQRG